MNSAENYYCRLCAELMYKTKLLNLQHDENKRREIVEKLNRVNVAINLCEDILPNTVCFKCVSALDRAFEFVKGIEQAQYVLNDIYLVKQIKQETQESSYSDEENFPFDSTDDLKDANIEVKQETVKDDLETLESLAVESNKEVPKKIIESSDSETLNLDELPLSQLELTWKDYSWTCYYCETQFETIDELRSHSMKYHENCNAYCCSDCKLRKLRLDRFLVHVKSHRKYLELSCYKCHKKFSTPYQTNLHVLEHKRGDHICLGCNTNFATSEDLDDHTKSFYLAWKLPLPVPDDLTCVLCKKTYKHRTTFNKHLLTHTDRKRDHTCDKCGKCFLNRRDLAGHMALHDNLRPYQCEICKAAFKTHNRLRNHVGVHDKIKPFACDQCGRCFRLRKQLSSHSITHTVALPHVCSYCNKGFRTKTMLNQHIRQHTGVKPYSCLTCPRDFTNWPNYNKHMKRRHGKDMSKNKRTPDGVYPVDPNTGEIVVPAETPKLLEWKKQIMHQRRPKVSPKMEVETTAEEAPGNEAEIAS